MKPLLKLILCLIAFLSIALIAEHTSLFKNSSLQVTESFQANYSEKKDRLEKYLETFVQKNKDLDVGEIFHEHEFGLNHINTKKGIAFFIYENDSMIYWSDNAIPINAKYFKPITEVIRLKNGWYQVATFEEGNRAYTATQLIKHKYSYQNKYLQDNFQEGFGIEKDLGIEIVEKNEEFKILSSDGQVVFSLGFDKYTTQKSGIGIFLSLFGFLGLTVCFLFLLMKVCTILAHQSEGFAVVTFIALIVGFRYILIEARFPSSLYDLEIFQPQLYGFTYWFPSLGDFLLNTLFIIYGAVLISNKRFKSKIEKTDSRKFNVVRVVLLFLILLNFSWFISDLFISLIMDSNISFDISNFADINEYSILGLLAIALLNYAFFLFCDHIMVRVKEMSLSTRQMTFSTLIALTLYIVTHHFFGYKDFALILWSVPVIVLIYYLRNQPAKSYTLYSVIGVVFLFVLFSSYTLLKYTTNKEHVGRERLANKLSVEKDPVTEYKLAKIGNSLMEDDFLRTELASGECTAANMDTILGENFFYELLARYEMQVTLCYPNDTLLVKPSNIEVPCISYFQDSIIGKSEKITKHFYLHDNPSGRTSYCALLRFDEKDSASNVPLLFIELNSKYIKTNVGFPELLLSGKVKTDIRNYTYAKYKNNRLVAQSGEYPYGLVPDDFIDTSKDKQYVDYDGFNHFVFKSNENNLIVLSKKTDQRLRPFTTGSYLFTFFSLVLFICLVIDKVSKGENPLNLNFKNRILFISLFMSFATVVIVASASIYYLKDQFEKKNQKTLNEKMSSIIFELEEHLNYPETYKNMDPGFIEKVLIRRANVFFTDVSLFSNKGNLLGTSRKEIFEEGFVSKKMNTNAMHNMVLHFKNDFFHEEQIGGLRYLSTYAPILGINNEPKAFVNLPYFAKQDMLESEISNFLATLLNVYVLLLMLSILMSILVSNTVSNPLRLLKEKMKNIQLGKSNEEIDWHVDDEIGSLIKEYNRMIAELGQSADLLAKSEREYAWREMAKQVAHEIKNPLTPMKLNVQQLKRSWTDKSEDWDEQLNKFSKTMAEQIDTLSNIASEFSNFAQMPSANNALLNLEEVISDVLYLYKDTENVKFKFEKKGDDDLLVLADKDQLKRVFNNLIKNSIQSFRKEGDNMIEINLYKKESSIVIEVEDNGAGIGDAEREKIFAPNFTTKTSGMGLGLAIVKNIIESANGRIWFDSESDKGTKFIIYLPSSERK